MNFELIVTIDRSTGGSEVWVRFDSKIMQSDAVLMNFELIMTIVRITSGSKVCIRFKSKMISFDAGLMLL